MLFAVGKAASQVAVIIGISIYSGLAGDADFLPAYLLIVVLDGEEDDLVGAGANRAIVSVFGDMLNFKLWQK